jgi:hypothetical protein
MIHAATNINTYSTIFTTTLAELARQLNISAKQLYKYSNNTKLFKKTWVITSGEAIKSKSKGRKF